MPAPLGAVVPVPDMDPAPPLPTLVDRATPAGSHSEKAKEAPAPPSPPPMAFPPAAPLSVAVRVQPVAGAVKFWPFRGVREKLPVGSTALACGPEEGEGGAPGDEEWEGVREGEEPGEGEAVGLGMQDTSVALPPTPVAPTAVLRAAA